MSDEKICEESNETLTQKIERVKKMKKQLTKEKILELTNIRTRTKSGAHFTQCSKYWEEFEELRLIKIDRPIHKSYDVEYHSQHWSLRITDDGQKVITQLSDPTPQPTAGHEPGKYDWGSDIEKLVEKSAIEIKEYIDRYIAKNEEPYLIEIEYLIRKHFSFLAKTPSLAAENERLRTALEFYANEEHYDESGAISKLVGTATGDVVEYDVGQIARDALTAGGDDG